MNYSFLYKKKIEDITPVNISSLLKYDLLISAYNESHRVKHTFENVDANEKHWLIFPEYEFEEIEIVGLNGRCFNFSNLNHQDEDEIILNYFEQNEQLISNSKVAIDITGMLRPYIVFLVRLLKEKKINKVDFIYSEPQNYKNKEETEFSLDYSDIREIKGCLGSPNPETTNDYLILGAGYDYQGITNIAKEKKEAKKIQVLGFPSLQADMFQQNILKSYKAEEDASSGEFDLDSKNFILAPANDPFITAQLISDFVKAVENKKHITNLYICPLATKAQTLGMALFYSIECLDKACSVIFPFSKKYSRETSKGISRVWVYTVEFPV
jgi:hypothetical protein